MDWSLYSLFVIATPLFGVIGGHESGRWRRVEAPGENAAKSLDRLVPVDAPEPDGASVIRGDLPKHRLLQFHPFLDLKVSQGVGIAFLPGFVHR